MAELGNVHDGLTYTSWGWQVLPCRPGAKVPATPHGCNDATGDPDQVIDWWYDVPTYNVAVATGGVSGLVVLDVDPGGAATMEELIRTHGPLPRTTVVQTPRDGIHGYFAHPGVPVRCSAGKLGPNVDVRGDGGYVLVPPSMVDSRPYRWRDEPWPGPPGLSDLPPEWLRLLTTDTEPPGPPGPVPPTVPGVAGRLAAWTTAAVRGELEAVATAVEGTRNARLNRAAFRLGQLAAGGALDPDAATRALEAVAAACGLPTREARRTIASGLSSGLTEPAMLPE